LYISPVGIYDVGRYIDLQIQLVTQSVEISIKENTEFYKFSNKLQTSYRK